MRERRELPAAWRAVSLVALWVVAALVLMEATTRVRDWFDMTDELRYERLAIAIARTHSLVPRIHGVDVHSFAQLYPLLIAPIFAGSLVPDAVVNAHAANAWIMSSACIPAYLLAQRVVGKRSWAYLVAALTVVMPWIVYSTMLMTEVAAYPASAWALLAIQAATVRPSWRNDLFALLGLALAFLGRTELLVLVFVPPPAIVAFELARTSGRAWHRLRDALRRSFTGHPLLSAAYAALLVAAVVAEQRGTLDEVFGVYGVFAQQNNLLPAGMTGSFATHLALLALGLGILPFLVGGAWLLANMSRPGVDVERQAFAYVGGLMTLGILFQGTNFDVRYTGFVHDRFLLYLVPPILIGMACALQGPLVPWWSLATVAVIACVGFATGDFPGLTWQQFPTLEPDSPMSALLRQIVGVTDTLHGARIFLVLATVLLAVLFYAGSRLLSPRTLAVITVAVGVAAMSAVTVATFVHLFDAPGWSSRPVTASESNAFDWIDQTVGTGADVTILPYPVSSDYFSNEQRWRDLEFYNQSITRDAIYPGDDTYAYTGIWFPKLRLSFDPKTGLANASPTSWVAQSSNETRFALVGAAKQQGDDVVLSQVDSPWRAQWLSFGLTDDGWTKPGVTGRVRIFPSRGQREPRIRGFAFAAHAPPGVTRAPLRIRSNLGQWTGDLASTPTGSLNVCVPAHGYAEVTIRTPVVATIPGDQATQAESIGTRQGGVGFGEIALSDEIGPRCQLPGSGRR